MDVSRLLPQGKIYQFKFEPGLVPRIGDSVYLRMNKQGRVVATNKSPNEGRVKNALVWIGIVRREACLRVGVITYADSYFVDGTCQFMCA